VGSRRVSFNYHDESLLSIEPDLAIRRSDPLHFLSKLLNQKRLKFVQKYEIVAQKLSIASGQGKRILVAISKKMQYF
jgi:hypothetical protein